MSCEEGKEEAISSQFYFEKAIALEKENEALKKQLHEALGRVERLSESLARLAQSAQLGESKRATMAIALRTIRDDRCGGDCSCCRTDAFYAGIGLGEDE